MVEKISHDDLLRRFHYNPVTGAFTRRVDGTKFKAGTIAGYTNKDGYWELKIGGKHYLAHRLAVFYMTGVWPPDVVDHGDRTRTNNRYWNLTPTSIYRNAKNRGGKSRATVDAFILGALSFPG